MIGEGRVAWRAIKFGVELTFHAWGVMTLVYVAGIGALLFSTVLLPALKQDLPRVQLVPRWLLLLLLELLRTGNGLSKAD